MLDRLAAYYFGRVTWRNKIVAGTRTAGDFARVPAFSDTTITGGISRMQYRDIGYKLFADMELDGHYAGLCKLTVIYTDSDGNVLDTVVRNFAAGSTYSIKTSVLERETDAIRIVYLPSVDVLTGTINADKTETVVCMTAAMKEGDILTIYAADGASKTENMLVIE